MNRRNRATIHLRAVGIMKESDQDPFAATLGTGVRWLAAVEQAKSEVERPQRSPAISDPRAAYGRAGLALLDRTQRLTKAAIAGEMGIDRGTLNTYIADHGLPFPPTRADLEGLIPH
ncbi:MAG: hypothetical protein ABI452_02855 [Candidatus Limnocylindrales bacterium]